MYRDISKVEWVLGMYCRGSRVRRSLCRHRDRSKIWGALWRNRAIRWEVLDTSRSTIRLRAFCISRWTSKIDGTLGMHCVMSQVRGH